MKEEFLQKRLLRYVGTHKSGVSGSQMTTWARSIRLHDITFQDVERALTALRNSGQIAIANGLWYSRC